MLISQIYEYYGTIEKAAKAVGVTRQMFHKWKKYDNMPDKYQELYEKVSRGKLKATTKEKKIA